jgi:hypothetical protein
MIYCDSGTMQFAVSSCGVAAANNGTPTTPKPTITSVLSKLKSWGKWYICGYSPEGAIENWMETGATKGAIGGMIAGAGTVGVATFGVGGWPTFAAFANVGQYLAIIRTTGGPKQRGFCSLCGPVRMTPKAGGCAGWSTGCRGTSFMIWRDTW